MNIHNIVQKAFSFCKRNITATQKGGVITRMVRDTRHSCDFKIDPSVGTACWRFDHKLSRHEIKCGTDGLASIANASTKASTPKMKRFIETVIRHETEHGIQTDRTSAVADQCMGLKIPFSLWNLFEDARIEYNSAIRKDGDGAFRWINFQDVEDRYNLASALFWAIKTREAGIKKQPSASVPEWDGATEVIYQGKPKKTRLVVLDFYRRAIAMEHSLDLLPMLVEWINIFGREVKPEHSNDVINGEADPNAKPSGQTMITPTGREKQTASGELPWDQWKRWEKQKTTIDKKLVARISRSLQSIVRNAKPVKNRLACNGNRIHATQAMQGSEQSFLNRGRTTGKRSLTLIVDMSGSMQYLWRLHGGKEFVTAFRELARRNKIDLNLIMTKTHRNTRKDVSHKVDSSYTDQDVANILTDGGAEGIMACMKRFLPLIKQSTTTVVFTDAELRDDDIDTAQYRNMGLNAIGCVIENDPSCVQATRNRMDDHFSRSVVGTDATELSRRLLREILKD